MKTNYFLIPMLLLLSMTSCSTYYRTTSRVERDGSMAQGYALQLQKQRYAEVLQERLRQHGDYYVACRLAQMQIDLGL